VVARLDGYEGHWNDARAASGLAARTENIDDVASTGDHNQRIPGTSSGRRPEVYAAGFPAAGGMVTG